MIEKFGDIARDAYELGNEFKARGSIAEIWKLTNFPAGNSYFVGLNNCIDNTDIRLVFNEDDELRGVKLKEVLERLKKLERVVEFYATVVECPDLPDCKEFRIDRIRIWGKGGLQKIIDEVIK